MSLEDKVSGKESEGFVKKAFKLGFNATAAVATTALSLATVVTTGVFIGGGLALGGAVAAAKKGKKLYNIVTESLRSYSVINAIIAPVLSAWNYTLPLVHAAFGTGIKGIVASTAYASTLFNSYFEVLSAGANHLIKNYLNPIGIVDSIKGNFYNRGKRSGTVFSPFYGLDANGVRSVCLW